MSEDIFKFATIDKVRNKLMTIKLEDKNGAEILIDEIITQVNDYIVEQLSSKEEDNVCLQQIFPLVACILNKSIISSMKGHTDLATGIVSQHLIRDAFMNEMLITYYFMKFIQKNNIKIISLQKDISEEDIKKAIITDKIGSFALMANMSGVPIKNMIDTIMKSGNISREELLETGLFTEEDFKNIKTKYHNDN